MSQRQRGQTQKVVAPGLQALTLLDWLQEQYPGRYPARLPRTLQRRVKGRQVALSLPPNMQRLVRRAGGARWRELPGAG